MACDVLVFLRALCLLVLTLIQITHKNFCVTARKLPEKCQLTFFKPKYTFMTEEQAVVIIINIHKMNINIKEEAISIRICSICTNDRSFRDCIHYFMK